MNKFSKIFGAISIALIALGLSSASGSCSCVVSAQGPTPTPTASSHRPYFSTYTRTATGGQTLQRSIIGGPPNPPPGFETAAHAPVRLPQSNSEAGTNSLTVPAYTWVYGCSAVSASMIAAYYDRNGYPNMYTGPTNGGVMPLDNSSWGTWTDGSGDTYPNIPLAASHNGVDGRATRGSIDDYWLSYGSMSSDPYLTGKWTQHTWGDAIGDYMKTSQSSYGNSDGSTSFYWWDSSSAALTCSDMVNEGIAAYDGTYGRKLFYQARGYTVTDCYSQRTDNNGGGFTYAMYKAEIDAGHPVMINLAGHTIVGVGYNDTGNLVYLNNTWDTSTHSMTWGSSYSNMQMESVSIVNLASAAPSITSLSPSTATPGGPAFTLTVNGANFSSGAIVKWNGSSRTTTYVNSSQLTASILSSDIASAGTPSVAVYSAGSTTTAATFTIAYQTPTISSLSPRTVVPGGPGFTLTVNGSNFSGTSVVRWNGSSRTTTYVGGAQLRAAILASDISSDSSVNVTVYDTTSRLGSSAATFQVAVIPPSYIPFVSVGP